MKTSIFKNVTDHAGMIAACVCVFHCVAMPILLISSTVGHASNNFHIWSLVLTVIITGHALWHGYKQHCKHIVMTFGAIGVVCLAAGVAFHFFGHDHGHSFSSQYPVHQDPFWMEHGEAIVTVIGSLFIIAAHVYNIKFKPKCCSVK